jgi:hypothetical protein
LTLTYFTFMLRCICFETVIKTCMKLTSAECTV